MRMSPAGFMFTAWKPREPTGDGERVYSLPVSCLSAEFLPTEGAVEC